MKRNSVHSHRLTICNAKPETKQHDPTHAEREYSKMRQSIVAIAMMIGNSLKDHEGPTPAFLLNKQQHGTATVRGKHQNIT